MAARRRKEVDTSTYEGRFAARLKELREKAKLTVEELAEKSGIPDKTLYSWEAATHMPTVVKLPELARALKVKIRNLLPES